MLAILGELCWLQFFKTVYLETSNVRFGSFFQNPVTFDGTGLDDVNVLSDVTTINMSGYFTDHPLVNTLYTISVSVLSDGGRSKPLSIIHGNVCV